MFWEPVAAGGFLSNFVHGLNMASPTGVQSKKTRNFKNPKKWETAENFSVFFFHQSVCRVTRGTLRVEKRIRKLLGAICRCFWTIVWESEYVAGGFDFDVKQLQKHRNTRFIIFLRLFSRRSALSCALVPNFARKKNSKSFAENFFLRFYAFSTFSQSGAPYVCDVRVAHLSRRNEF